MKKMKLPFKSYAEVFKCLEEVNSLREDFESFVVGLPYVTKKEALFSPEAGVIKCKYHMDCVEEANLDFNRLDRANNFSFRFIHDSRIYEVGNDEWTLTKVTSHGFFSEEENWNLEWSIRGFTRGRFLEKSKSLGYFRYITPLENNTRFLSSFEIYSKWVGKFQLINESTRIKIEDSEFDFYAISYNGRKYLLIDNLSPMDCKKFDDCIMALIFGTGFINQHIVLTESFTFRIDHPVSGKPIAMRYRSLRESIKGQYAIFTTNAYSVRVPLGQLYGFEPIRYIRLWSNRLFPVRSDVMNSLCTILYKYPNIINVVAILVDASRSGLEIQGASLAVALETLTHEIATNKLVKLAKVKPVVDKTRFKALRKVMENIVESSSLNDAEKEFVKNKIPDLNQPTNRDKLLLPFPALGIYVSKAMVEVIEQRNVFLHGRYEFSMEEEQIDRLVWICKAMHQLCCILLFKLAGFSGYIVDQTAFDPKIGSISGCNRGFIWI